VDSGMFGKDNHFSFPGANEQKKTNRRVSVWPLAFLNDATAILAPVLKTYCFRPMHFQ